LQVEPDGVAHSHPVGSSKRTENNFACCNRLAVMAYCAEGGKRWPTLRARKIPSRNLLRLIENGGHAYGPVHAEIGYDHFT